MGLSLVGCLPLFYPLTYTFLFISLYFYVYIFL